MSSGMALATRWPITAAITILLCVAPQAMATSEPEPDPFVLDMNAALALAMTHNTDLKIAKNVEGQAESLITEAIGVALPDLTFSGTYTHRGNLPTATFGDQEFQLMPDNDTTFNLNLHQWLFSGSVGAGLRGTRHMLAAAKARSYAARSDIIALVATRFYAVLFNRELVTVQEESVRQLRSHLTDSKEREAVGLNTSYDTLRFETRLARAIPVLIEVKNRLEKTKIALLDTLGINPLTRVEIVGELAFEPYSVNAEDAVAKALSQRQELIASREDKNVAHEYVRAAEGESLPKIKAFGNYRYTSSPGDLTSEEAWHDEWNAGITIELNLFDGRERSSRVKQRILDKDTARLNMARVERLIVMEAKNAFDEFKRAQEFVASQEKNVSYAEETYRIAKERHAVGMDTQLELLDTQLSLTRAKADHSRSLYDYLTAKAKLKRAMGEEAQKVE